MDINELKIWITIFLTYAFAGTLCLTASAIFLDGFKAWGFKVSQKVLLRLITATICELAGLLGIAYRSIFF